MSTTSILTASWKNEFPEFHSMMIKFYGDMQYVDEYDVPFWGNISSVSIRQNHHPLFTKETQVALLSNCHHHHQPHLEEHLHTIQETLHFYNSEVEFWLGASKPQEWREPLANTAIRLPKDLYNRFKISCGAVLNTPPVPASKL